MSDVVVRGDVPEAVRKSMELWVGCVAGALHEDEYKQLLADAGFGDVDVEPWRVYSTEDARQFLGEAGLDTDTIARQVDGAVASAFIRATRPQGAEKAAACCGPTCCA